MIQKGLTSQCMKNIEIKSYKSQQKCLTEIPPGITHQILSDVHPFDK